ncbi:MAG: hypothetical protein ACI33P_10055 [Lysinibacillus sp.]
MIIDTLHERFIEMGKSGRGLHAPLQATASRERAEGTANGKILNALIIQNR